LLVRLVLPWCAGTLVLKSSSASGSGRATSSSLTRAALCRLLSKREFSSFSAARWRDI
jgi:hypothetical protein